MNIVNIVIGNICSLLAMGTDCMSSYTKTIKSMLWLQNTSQLLYGIGAIVLKGYSGAVQNFVCLVRNLTVIKGIKSKVLEWSFVVAGVVIGLCFNNLGFMGLLPIIANLQYSLAIFKFKNNQRAVKISFLISSFLFTFFSLAILNFVGVFSNLVVAGVTITFLVKSKSKQKN